MLLEIVRYHQPFNQVLISNTNSTNSRPHRSGWIASQLPDATVGTEIISPLRSHHLAIAHPWVRRHLLRATDLQQSPTTYFWGVSRGHEWNTISHGQLQGHSTPTGRLQGRHQRVWIRTTSSNHDLVGIHINGHTSGPWDKCSIDTSNKRVWRWSPTASR